MVDAICHPDDLAGVGILSGRVTENSLCHPDYIPFYRMSSERLNWGWYLIRMNYGNVIMAPGWDTLLFLSHLGEMANFDFSQHTVALQRFRSFCTIIIVVLCFRPVVTMALKPRVNISGDLDYASRRLRDIMRRITLLPRAKETSVLRLMAYRYEALWLPLQVWVQSLIARFMGPTWGPSGADRT